MLVHPAPGLTIIRPDTNQPLPAAGADVPDTDWCLRRLRDGDVLPGLLNVGPATTFTASLSAASGPINAAVTLTLTPNGAWPVGTILTPAAAGLTGTFAPATSTPVGSIAASFAFTSTAVGSGTLTAAASPVLTAITGALAYSATAAGTVPVPPPTPTPGGTPTQAQFEAMQAAHLASLPRTLPGAPGVEWNNDGTLAIS